MKVKADPIRQGEATLYGYAGPYDDEVREEYFIEDVLPRQVMEWLGLMTEEGMYDDPDGDDSLIGHNDSGDTFKQIANIIESAPEGLFR